MHLFFSATDGWIEVGKLKISIFVLVTVAFA